MSQPRRSFAVRYSVLLVTALSFVALGAASQDHPIVTENRERQKGLTERVDEAYLIGPDVANKIDYRIAWQARLSGPNKLQHVGMGPHGIYVLDDHNRIARLRPSDGEVLWRTSVADEVDIFRGVTWADVPVGQVDTNKGLVVATEPRAFLSTDTECFSIDPASGVVVDRQRFSKLPATAPLAVGAFLIYGTVGGQVVWHNCVVGHELRANSLDSTVRGKPVRAGNTVIAASEHGMVLCMDLQDARRVWAARTLGGIWAAPAVGDGMVFVPSDDQYLWAFDVHTGAMRWRYFTQSELRTSPFAFNDAVLQQIPDEGLVCLAAKTNGKTDGIVRWRNAEVTGVPIGIFNGRVILWDPQRHILTAVDPKDGVVLNSAVLPQVDEIQLVTTAPFAHDIFALNKDGRVLRLTPKRAMEQPEAEPMEKKKSNEPVPLSIPANPTPAGDGSGDGSTPPAPKAQR